jgi:hypothetical protein
MVFFMQYELNFCNRMNLLTQYQNEDPSDATFYLLLIGLNLSLIQ